MKHRCATFLGAALGSVALGFAPMSDAREAGRPGQTPAAGETGSTGRASYARPFERPTRPAFLALPPGAVEPAGWLRDWCLAARDGYTGHMDEYDPEFRRAWAPDHKMTGEGLFWYKGAWPYEGGGYWFDGLARLGFALHDEGLIAQAKRRLYAVADNMNTTGLLFLWWLDRNNPDDRKAVTAALEGWPLWACGLLGRAMTGFYAASGDRHILEALEKAYAPDPDCLRWITGNVSNLWPAFDTYSSTGNPGIAAALDAMFAEGGAKLLPSLSRYRAAPDLKPGTVVDNAHVVEFIESTTPWAVGYLWTGDERYLRAAVGWHDLLERVAMQPHGVPVADEWYGPTGAFRGSETCDVAGYVWSQISLLLVTGEGRMADRLERAFFNAGPATVSRDFRTHVYFQSPNRFASHSPDFPHGPRASGGNYQPKHSPLCCTAALNRIVPWYVTHMWTATYDGGLAATCYGPCKVTALAADRVPVVIACRTDYPFDETIEISVEPAMEAAFPLYFHVPGWCADPALSVNGSAVAVERNAKGFARISRSWKPDDTVRLHLPMTATVRRGRDAASGPPYDGAHRATPVAIPEEDSTGGVPYASVCYGPLLFALPIPDISDANTPDPSARWRFALDVQNPSLTVERTAMPARWDWPLDAPLKLRANAVEIPWSPDPKAPRLPLLAAARSKEVERITLVPYGSTKFRISMFPVTADPEVKSASIRRVLFLGNSITLHGPKADIGWTGNWGMAASSEDKDYVHLVAGALARHTGSTPQIMVRNIADFERNYAAYDVDGQMKDLFAFDPDLVVLAIGENVPELSSDGSKAQFRAGVLSILRCALARRHPLVVVRGSFWADAAKDQVLRQACEEAGGIFVDAGPLGREPLNAARSERSFTHDGVAGHPGDRGMKALADAIVKAVLERGAPAPVSAAPAPAAPASAGLVSAAPASVPPASPAPAPAVPASATTARPPPVADSTAPAAPLPASASLPDEEATRQPVLSFAWISDLHLDGGRLELTKAAFRFVDERLAPDFVLFTGDDNAIPAPPEDPAAPEPEDLRRHRFFRDFLATHLRAPAVVIPGDNWPGGFDRVFGPAQRSFDCSGLHFLLLAPDRTHKGPGMEGLSALDEATWAWIRADLDASRGVPVIVAIHEPIHPPTFLDAMPMRRLLAGYPQVIAVLQGHLHVDLDLEADGKAYLTAPALGPTSAPAFKHLLVFPDRLVVRTFARDPKTGEFARNRHEGRVEVPRALGANLRRPDGGFRLGNLAAPPPRPHVDDPTLVARRWELLRNLTGLLDRDVRQPAKSPPAEVASPPK